VEYCQRYEDLDRLLVAQGHAGGGGGMLGGTALLPSGHGHALMAAGDAVLLVAYLDLFT
jgi:hypothetical protein